MTPSLVLRRFWTLEPAAYSLRVFIALAGITLLSWWRGDMAGLIPLFLGAIASALAETDDDWSGRLAALLVTLVCFALASLAMELLFAHPWPLVVTLGLAAFGMTMLGAVSQRYATIANATLILTIYTLISLEQRGGPHSANCGGSRRCWWRVPPGTARSRWRGARSSRASRCSWPWRGSTASWPATSA